MVRYILAFVVYFVGIAFLVSVSSGQYFDFSSIILDIVLPFLFICILFGVKEAFFCFATPFKKESDKKQLKKALKFFKAFGKVIWLNFVLMMSLSIVSVLNHDFGGDFSSLPQAVSLMIISVFNCVLVTILIVVPYKIVIKKRMIEIGQIENCSS